MPKLLLIQPSLYRSDGKTLIKQRKLHLPGLVFPLLAALVPRGWSVDVCLEIIEDIDYDADADLVGIGTMGHSIFRGIDIAREFKKRGKPVFFGGYMPSLLPHFLDDEADSVVVGDAEISFPMLLSDFESGRGLQKIYDHPVASLQGLPVPSYEVLLGKKIGDMLPVQAGRGCSHSCSFCSIAAIYKNRYLMRPADEVVRDIRAVRDLGFKKFLLIDDNIASKPEYLEELCGKIRPLGMTWASQCSISIARNDRLLRLAAASGCTILSFGIETITQAGLDRLNKKWMRAGDHKELLQKVADAGILPSTEMMFGLDGDTEDSLRATFDFVQDLRLPIPRFYIMTPIPGTPLFEQFRKEGRLAHEDFSRYTGYCSVYRPALMSGERLDEMYRWLNRRVYSWRSILRRTLLNPHARLNPRTYFLAFLVNLQYMRHVRQNEIPVIF